MTFEKQKRDCGFIPYFTNLLEMYKSQNKEWKKHVHHNLLSKIYSGVI